MAAKVPKPLRTPDAARFAEAMAGSHAALLAELHGALESRDFARRKWAAGFLARRAALDLANTPQDEVPEGLRELAAGLKALLPKAAAAVRAALASREPRERQWACDYLMRPGLRWLATAPREEDALAVGPQAPPPLPEPIAPVSDAQKREAEAFSRDFGRLEELLAAMEGSQPGRGAAFPGTSRKAPDLRSAHRKAGRHGQPKGAWILGKPQPPTSEA